MARFLRHRLPDAGARAQLRRARRRVQAGARSAAQLRRRRAGAVQGRRAQSRLCALCAGAQRRRSGRRSALFRRHQARRDRHPDRQGADRGGAGPARRPRARRARLCGGARRSRAATGARLRPHRLRLGAARCGGAGDARLGKRRARCDHHHRGATRRGRAQPDALHLDAGERVDGARRPRARQGRPGGVADRRWSGAGCAGRRAARSTAATGRAICPAAA